MIKDTTVAGQGNLSSRGIVGSLNEISIPSGNKVLEIFYKYAVCVI